MKKIYGLALAGVLAVAGFAYAANASQDSTKESKCTNCCCCKHDQKAEAGCCKKHS